MKTVIYENQRGLLFKNGKFLKLLEPGKYYTFGDKIIEMVDLEDPLQSGSCSLDQLLRDEKIAAKTSMVEVPDEKLALHFVDGKFSGCLMRGKHAFWNIYHEHSFTLIDISTPEVSDKVPAYIFTKIPNYLYTKVEVLGYQKGRLYFNNELVRLLEPGTYYFWKNSVKVEVSTVDTRLTQLDISGQEILTQDKVALRINFVCNYRITDYVKILTEIDDYKEQIHVAVQLALREFVGKHPIDAILESKEQISTYVFERLKTKEKDLYVEFKDAGVKDIILPGEIRSIMNTVLIAEKKAQANVITRREEVASTRSLLNTARLLEENKTLYKLKELEYLERISQNIGSINVSGSGDILSQLAALIKGV